MATSTPPDNTVFELFLPQVNGQTYPVGANIGVPLVAYDLVTDGEGAVVLIDPPLSGTMDRGDVITLLLKGESAALDSETVVDPDARTTLRIPKGRLHPDRVNELYYTITRGSSNIAILDPPLTVLYNRVRPGLKDRLTNPGGHSELFLLLPDIIKNGVGPDFVSAEVCVAYPYCRAYDLISLKCNGELLEPKPKVNPNQAPTPPNPGDENLITICFTVTRAFLDKAKRLDNKLHFSYSVTDQLGNGPDTDAPWSPVQSVDEDLDGTRLPMALLLERLEDYPGDDLTVIDLARLAGKPLNLVVVTADKRFEAGDSIYFTYTAKVPGQPDVVVPLTGTVEADAFGQKKPCIVQVDNDKIPAGASVTVTYELRRPNGDLLGNSNPANATVTGAAPIQLQPVVLLAPATNPIDPLNNSTGVTVQATYLQALPGDKALLVVAGATPFPPVTLNPNKQADFRLDAKFLAERLGSDSRIIWQLIRDDKVIAESPEFILTVSAIKPEDPRFPTPTIIAVKDDRTLNLGSFVGDTRMLVAPWRLIAEGQPFWAWCEGTNSNGATVTEEIHNGVPIGSTSNQGGPVSREFLDKLADGSTIRVYVAVNLAGGVNPATRVLFPVRSYTVKALEDVKPTIESAKDSKGGDIAQNGTTTDTTITLTGTASKGQSVKILDGTTDHGDAIADASSGVWTKTITGLSLEAHSFTAKALYGTGQISGAWALTVVSELKVDTSPITLDGLIISLAGSGSPPWSGPNADPINTFASRPAEGGVPPYKYSSSAPQIASVDQSGMIRSHTTGKATIHVTDALLQEKIIQVTSTSRTITMRWNPSYRMLQYTAWANSVGGRGSDTRIIAAINSSRFTIPNLVYGTQLGPPTLRYEPNRAYYGNATNSIGNVQAQENAPLWRDNGSDPNLQNIPMICFFG